MPAVAQNNDGLQADNNNDFNDVNPPIEYESINVYNIKELKEMAKGNIILPKNISKQDLYDLLLNSNLIPMK